MTRKDAEPNHKVGDVVMLYPKGKVRYVIVSRSPHPIRPDWPWRYELKPINHNLPARKCIDDDKIYRVYEPVKRAYYVEGEEEEL